MLKLLVFTASVAILAPGMALAAQQAVPPNQSPAPPLSITPDMPHAGPQAQPAQPSDQQSLSEQLSRSNGTIRPPPVDQGMQKLPPPTRGNMPILKPPPRVQSR